MTELASYIYSTYSTILNLSTEGLLQVGYNTNDSCPIPSFDQELLIYLCQEAQSIFSKEDIVLKFDGDVIVVGDIHGNLHDLLRILNYIDINQYKVLFLGDYVDRGNFSLECISLLFALKILFPNNYFLLRGNHEFDIVCTQYGFKKEIIPSVIPKGNYLPKFQKYSSDKKEQELDQSTTKNQVFTKDDSSEIFFKSHPNLHHYQYDESLYKAFMKAFSFLPISAIINNTSICIHGGLSPLLTKVDDIRNLIHRPIDNFDNELLCDLLWGDPFKKKSDISQLYDENPRGKGKLFSGIAVSDFLKGNFLRRLIRGHECVTHGTEMKFNEKCITVFSASSYSKEMGNKSGILKVLKKGDQIEPVTFQPILQLNRNNANFFKVQPYFEKNAPSGPSKTFFTMTTARPPAVPSKSDQLFPKAVGCVLKETARLNNSFESLASSESYQMMKLKGPNTCPSGSLNRKSKLSLKNVRNVNGSFAFNTGIQKRRQSSVNIMLQKGLPVKIPNQAFQSDNQSQIEVDNMGRVEDDGSEEVNIQQTKVLPKLVVKNDV